MRGKRENFFSREKKFSRSPRAPLTLSRKAKNFFIYFYLPLSETEPSRKGKGKRAYHSAPTNGRRKSTPLFSKREGQKSIPFRADQRKAQKYPAFLEKGWGLGKGKTSFPAKRSFPLPQDHHHPFPRTKKACDQTRPQRQR